MITTIEHPKNSGRIYTCEPFSGDTVRVTAKPGAKTHTAIAGQAAAIGWLCDRSLRKSKSKALVAAALGKTHDDNPATQQTQA